MRPRSTPSSLQGLLTLLLLFSSALVSFGWKPKYTAESSLPQVSYCEKRHGTRSAWNSIEHFHDPQFGCSTLVSHQFKSQDQSKESISRFLLQHSYSCELLHVVINRRLLNNADLNQERLLHGVFSGICLSHVYHQAISWLWLKIWLMLCKCQKMDEGRQESIWRGFGYSCTPMHC